jgi:very-short-patch-repair endonuclease
MHPMGCTTHHSAGVWRLAELQHGVVARWQLQELGFSRRAVEVRLSNGRLHSVGHGVFAVGRPHLTVRGRWMVAVLSCGPSAVLSHGSAAALWGIGFQKHLIEVSVRTCSPRRQSGVLAHRRAGLRDVDLTRLDGIPTTGPIRTIVDVAARLDPEGIERMVNEADRLDLVDPDTLRDALGPYRGQRGVARLRAVLDRHTFRLTRSGLERRFLRIAERAGMAVPETRQWVNGFEVDFYWPELGLVVETDGVRYHRTPARQTRDRRRDQTHTVAGLTQLRFTEAQIKFEPAYVVETLRRVVGRLEAA